MSAAGDVLRDKEKRGRQGEGERLPLRRWQRVSVALVASLLIFDFGVRATSAQWRSEHNGHTCA